MCLTKYPQSHRATEQKLPEPIPLGFNTIAADQTGRRGPKVQQTHDIHSK
jgi:hypothetical protein